jgi:hypothetical protein
VKTIFLLADEVERDIPYDPEPIGRFNVAPGTKVLLLSERDEKLHLDPVIWGYAPGWWDKPPLINARSLKLRPPAECLNHSGNTVAQFALLMAGLSGKRKATKSSPTSFIGPMVSRYYGGDRQHHSNVEMKQKVSDSDGCCRQRTGRYSRQAATGTVTRSCSRMDEAGRWREEAAEIAADGSVPAEKFIWHAVTRAVGNVKIREQN